MHFTYNIQKTPTSLKKIAFLISISVFGLMSVQSMAHGASKISAPFNKAAGVPHKPPPTSFQKPVKQPHKPSTAVKSIKKPFTTSATGVKPKPTTTSKPLPVSTLPKKWLVPKAAPGGNPLPAAGSGGKRPPVAPPKFSAVNSSPKKLTPVFNKAAGVPLKPPPKGAFQTLNKKPPKSPIGIKNTFDKASKLPLKPTNLKKLPNKSVKKGAGKEIGILRDAAKGKGNFGLGAGTRAEANKLGRAWVGKGAKLASDGKTLVSKDGMRQYRPPSYKGKIGKTQANFEQRIPGQTKKTWHSNGHLDITD